MAKVVLAETEPSVRKKLPGLLPAPYKLESPKSPQTVVERVRTTHPDLVILEVCDTGVSGLNLLKEIRRLDENQAILVLVKSSLLNRVVALGVSEFVIQPFDIKELRLRIVRCLAQLAQRRPAMVLPLKELHDSDTGRLDAQKIADYLDVPLSKVAQALNLNYTTLHKTPAAASAQEALAPIKRSLAILSSSVGDRSNILAWLNSQHPDLGNRTPLQVILEGHAGALCTILENALDGTPS